MTVRQEFEQRDQQSYYQRFHIDDGDTLYVEFSSISGSPGAGINQFSAQSFFIPGVNWHVTPDDGGRVKIEQTFRPDFVRSRDSDWYEHGVHPEVTERTGYREDAEVGAMRYTAASGGAVIEVRSPIKLTIGA